MRLLVGILITIMKYYSVVYSLETAQGTEETFHPFLYFSEEKILTFRRQARTTHEPILRQIRAAVDKIYSKPSQHVPPKTWNEFASSWNEHYGNNLCVLAMHSVLHEWDPKGRKLAFVFMNALTNLKNWRVNSTPMDDVPVAHSLNGMATAYDFLYPYMDSNQRQKYLKKIVNETRELYRNSRRKWWGRSYIQNHVFTNYVALLTSALVASRHSQYSTEAKEWISKSKLMLSRNMYLLNYVIDGSIDEGVSYGTYTSRSVTQFVYLASRHLDLDLTRSFWLKQHFYFLYYTILPGFRKTVGIADSNRNWFYGPESQLVFLDAYVMRNGWGNWLASQIKRDRPQGSSFQASSMVNCMLHTEFLFYNASIKPIEPPGFYAKDMHVFSDWGVVIYRDRAGHWSASINRSRDPNQAGTFLSFKCSVLHGRAVNKMVTSKPPVSWVRGFHNFNPGHEHLDQGSFVFAPNGVPFITESLYGPKYTWLNNAILFGPSFTSPCSKPLEGQLGECLKWLDYRNMQPWRARGEVTTAVNDEGLVLTCGEMGSWYRAGLGLASVYRCLVLLAPSVLLVVDHVERFQNTTSTVMSSFFHNMDSPFSLDECAGVYACAKNKINGENYRVLGINSLGVKQGLLLGFMNYSTRHQLRQTFFVNITTPLKEKYTRAAYLFLGPGQEVRELRMLSTSDHGVHITVTVNGVKYTVAIATKHRLAYTRFRWLGFGGYAKLRIQRSNRDRTIRFGLNSLNETHLPIIPHEPFTSGHFFTLVSFPMAAITVVVMFLYFQLTRTVAIRTCYRVTFIFLMLAWGIIAVLVLIQICTNRKCSLAVSKQSIMENVNSGFRKVRRPVPPFVVTTSLPLGGAELLGVMLQNDNDFYHFRISHKNFNAAAQNSSNAPRFQDKETLDTCDLYRFTLPAAEATYATKWFKTFMQDQRAFDTKLPKRADTSFPALRLDPGWSLRVEWLRKVVGNRLKAVIVVRDPRSWVNAWLKELQLNRALLRKTKASVLDLKEHRCRTEEENHFVPELKGIQRILNSVPDGEELSSHKLLAHLWSTHTSAVLRLIKYVPRGSFRLERLEDFITKPERTVGKIYRFMALVAPPRVKHRMVQKARTESPKAKGSHEVMGPKLTSYWKTELTESQIREIESICSLVMAELNYKPVYATRTPTSRRG